MIHLETKMCSSTHVHEIEFDKLRLPSSDFEGMKEAPVGVDTTSS